MLYDGIATRKLTLLSEGRMDDLLCWFADFAPKCDRLLQLSMTFIVDRHYAPLEEQAELHSPFPVSHDLNFSNRPVRPGWCGRGVARAAPMPIKER